MPASAAAREEAALIENVITAQGGTIAYRVTAHRVLTTDEMAAAVWSALEEGRLQEPPPGGEESMRTQTARKLTSGDQSDALAAGITAAFGPMFIDGMVDAFVTPQAFLAAISRGKPEPVGGQSSPPSQPKQSVRWEEMDYAFFRSPITFAVEARQIALLFTFRGLGWTLTGVELNANPSPSG